MLFHRAVFTVYYSGNEQGYYNASSQSQREILWKLQNRIEIAYQHIQLAEKKHSLNRKKHGCIGQIITMNPILHPKDPDHGI